MEDNSGDHDSQVYAYSLQAELWKGKLMKGINQVRAKGKWSLKGPCGSKGVMEIIRRNAGTPCPGGPFVTTV